jgi:hypothetical protein
MGKEFSIRVRRMKRRVEDREEGIDNVVEYAIADFERRELDPVSFIWILHAHSSGSKLQLWMLSTVKITDNRRMKI